MIKSIRNPAYWIFQKDRDMVGHNKEKCQKIGHVLVPQFNKQDGTVHQFCYNCGQDVSRLPR